MTTRGKEEREVGERQLAGENRTLVGGEAGSRGLSLEADSYSMEPVKRGLNRSESLSRGVENENMTWSLFLV